MLIKQVNITMHHALLMSINLKNITILNIRGVNNRFIINGVSKSEAVNLLQNVE